MIEKFYKHETRPIDDLKPYTKNARTHSPEQIKQIAHSIKKFGFTNPVLIRPDNSIIAGHGRVMAGKELKLKHVPVIIIDGLSDNEIQALIIADNSIALNAGWDDNLLKIELGEIELNFGREFMDDLGFNFDLNLDFNNEPELNGDPDEVPEPPKDPISKLGDIYQLGNHRLMCGDSTDEASILILMDGKKADMVFTSPPYNANTKTGDGDAFKKNIEKVNLYADGYKDNLKRSEYIDFAKKVLDICFKITDGFIFWNVNYNANAKFEYIAQIVDKLEFLIEQIAWKKSSVIPYKGMLRRGWEPIYVFNTAKKGFNLQEVHTNIWEVSNTDSQEKNHKACFPVDLPIKAIELCNPKLTFEPFCGSGTTLIACEKTNRICYGMELDPVYCDVIIARWEKLTGKKAVKIN